MKKLLLLAAGALLSASAMNAQWAVVGNYCDWSFQTATTFSGEGDELSCTIDNLTTGFKIVDITNDNWDTQYGTATPIEMGVDYVLDAKNGGDDPQDMSFANDVAGVKDAVVTWNPTTATFKVTGTPYAQEVDASVIYLVGQPQGWGINNDSMPLAQVEEGVYSATYEINAGDAMFRFYKALGNWETNSIGSQVQDNAIVIELTDGEYEGECVNGKGSWNIPDWEGGKMTLVVDLNNMKVNFYAGEVTVEPGPGPVETWSVYYENSEGWDAVYIWAWVDGGDGADMMGTSWPGKPMTLNDEGLWYYEGEGMPDYVIFNNGAGVQTSNFAFENGATYDFNGIAGVESIIDMNAPAIYYNLQGVKVNNPQRGIFVVKQGNKTSKVVIR